MTGSCKPTLGYRSRTEAVLALRDQGLTTGEIAKKIGIPDARVGALEAAARRRGAGSSIRFARDELAPLKPDAAARGIAVEDLVRRLVTTIGREKMVDAVLDDEGGA